MNNRTLMDLPPLSLNLLCGSIFAFIVCLGIRIVRAPEVSLKVADTQIVVTNSAGKLEEISGELEEQAELLKQKDMAYEELLQAYESYRTEQEGGEELEGAIKAIKELPKVDNIEELQLKIQETENDLIEVTNE